LIGGEALQPDDFPGKAAHFADESIIAFTHA
jgi:hypothetical protein